MAIAVMSLWGMAICSNATGSIFLLLSILQF